MFTSSSLSLIDAGTGFTSTDSGRWYWVFVTALLSYWTSLSVNNLLQFLAIAVTTDVTNSNLLKKPSNRFDKSESFDDISSAVMSSSISSSFERFSNWLHVRIILVRDDDRIWKLRIRLRLIMKLEWRWQKGCLRFGGHTEKK